MKFEIIYILNIYVRHKMERQKDMGLTNYNMNNMNLFGSNWQTGSGIVDIFSGVPGTNVNFMNSVFGNGYYSSSSTSSNNSALGWALGGIGVSMGALLLTSLISNSSSRKSDAAEEASSNKAALESVCEELGLDSEDIDSLTEASIDKIVGNNPETYKNTEFYKPVETAEEKVKAAEIEVEKCDTKEADIEGYNTSLDAYKPANSSVSEKITVENIGTADAIINKVIGEWNNIKDKGANTDSNSNPQYNLADAMISSLNDLKTKIKEWQDGGKKAEALKQAQENKKKADDEVKNAKTEAEEKINAKKKEAKECLKAYQSSKLSSDSIDDVDGTAFSRLFGQRNAKIDKDGNITDKNGEAITDTSDFETKDWKRILAAYRKGDSSTKKQIGEWVSKNVDENSIEDRDCKQLIKIIKSKYNTNA